MKRSLSEILRRGSESAVGEGWWRERSGRWGGEGGGGWGAGGGRGAHGASSPWGAWLPLARMGEGAYDELSTVSLPLIVQAAITARGGGFLQSEVGEEGVSSLR